jgi:membrane-associated phospholipid phosphatase
MLSVGTEEPLGFEPTEDGHAVRGRPGGTPSPFRFTPADLLRIAAAASAFFLLDLAVVLSGLFARPDGWLKNLWPTPYGPTATAHVISTIQSFALVDIMGAQLLFELTILGLALVALTTHLLLTHRPWSALLLLAGPLGALVFTSVLKALIVRPPPRTAGGHTFPSSHAAVSLALFLVLAFLAWHSTWPGNARRVAIATLGAVTILVGLSTLYGHYPTEVLGGYALSIAWMCMIFVSMRRPLRREITG